MLIFVVRVLPGEVVPGMLLLLVRHEPAYRVQAGETLAGLVRELHRRRVHRLVSLLEGGLVEQIIRVGVRGLRVLGIRLGIAELVGI